MVCASVLNKRDVEMMIQAVWELCLVQMAKAIFVGCTLLFNLPSRIFDTKNLAVVNDVYIYLLIFALSINHPK